jgi:predicted transcriptional regulator
MTIASTAPMSLKLHSDTREGLRSLAILKNRPAHALAREAVERYVVAEFEREKLTQAADKAWEHYQDTGLHATSDEVFAWVDSWGTANPLPKPICHT